MNTMNSENLKKIHQLTESFINEVEKSKLNEGMADTAKARWAGLKGGIKGFGNQVRGNVNQATGNLVNKGISAVAKGLGGDPSKSSWAKSAQNLADKGASQIHTGKNQAYTEKYNAYIQSAVDSIVNDLQSLNINVKDKSKLVADLNKSIKGSTQQPAKPLGAKPSTPAPTAQPKAATVAPAKPSTPAPTAQPKAAPVAPANVAQTQVPQSKPVNVPKGKQYAGQWLSPTQRVSMSGPQQGVMNISPDDPSQVENPHSPKYNQAIADKRVSNAQKAYSNTPLVDEPVQPDTQNSVDLTTPAKPKAANADKKKKAAEILRTAQQKTMKVK